MSRRKQGRPQQRKTLETLEQENDLLVCGLCQTNFALQDILKFIRHKVTRCNKENADVETSEFEDGDEPDSESTAIGNKTPRISAPITRKEHNENRLSPRPSSEPHTALQDSNINDKNLQSNFLGDKEFPCRSPSGLSYTDRSCNTDLTEPASFICEKCRGTFDSAWNLLQHVQRHHGIKIYSDINLSCPTPPKQPRVHDPSAGDRPPSHHRHSPHPHRNPNHHRDHRDRDAKDHYHDTKERDIPSLQNSIQHEILRTSSTASSGSAESGHGQPVQRQSPQNPFLNFRFPFDRPPLSPGTLPFPRHPATEFAAITSEALHIQRAGGLIGFPNLFEAGRSFPPGLSNPFERRPPSIGIESPINSQIDSFYSERLKSLAQRPQSPVRHQTPPFSQARSGSTLFNPPSASTNTTPTDTNKDHGSGSLTPPNKLKSCEFCGKSFRFQSNLIVHRRSHTGEKPFKCPLCPHACTQQSKLKRHMKTHMKSSMANLSEGSMASGSSTPENRKFDEKDEDDDEEEDEDEEEEDIEDFEEDEDVPNDSNEKKENIGSPVDSKDRVLTENLGNSNSSPSELTHKMLEARLGANSLLSEVMNSSGLRKLHVYNEAFKQALAENKDLNIKKEVSSPEEDVKDCSDNGSSVSNSNGGIKEESNTAATSRPSSDSEQESSKISKSESNDVSAMNNVGSHDSVYPQIWSPYQPPPHEFFPLLPTHLNFRFGQDPNHNGFSSNSDSALKSLSLPGGLPKPSSSNNLDSNGIPSAQRRDNKRNDTCEYCGKVFKNCSNLTVHRRSHTGEKPYKCELCNYACAQSSKLTRHMKTHGRIGKDVYRCKFCGMPFSVASTLEKHMRKCVEKSTGIQGLTRDVDSDNSNSMVTSGMHDSPNSLPLSNSVAQ